MEQIKLVRLALIVSLLVTFLGALNTFMLRAPVTGAQAMFSSPSYPTNDNVYLPLHTTEGQMCVITPVNTCTPTPTNTPIPTNTPVPTSTPIGSTLTISKGLAGIQYCSDLTGTNTSTFYHWNPYIRVCDGAESVPMVRDWDDIVTLIDEYYAQGVNMPSDLLGGNSAYILGVNEYDTGAGQANMTLRQTAIHQYMMEALFPDLLIGAPVATPRNTQLIVSLANTYWGLYNKAPRWDFMPVHCYFYGDPWIELSNGTLYKMEDIDTCKSIINNAIRYSHTYANGRVWITELGVMARRDDDGEIDWQPARDKAEEFLTWLESKPEVERVYWYTHRLPDHDTWYWPGSQVTTAAYHWNTHDLTLLGIVLRDW